MSHATSTTPGSPVVLDWRHAETGPPAPCVLCDGQTVCRSPAKGVRAWPVISGIVVYCR